MRAAILVTLVLFFGDARGDASIPQSPRESLIVQLVKWATGTTEPLWAASCRIRLDHALRSIEKRERQFRYWQVAFFEDGRPGDGDAETSRRQTVAVSDLFHGLRSGEDPLNLLISLTRISRTSSPSEEDWHSPTRKPQDGHPNLHLVRYKGGYRAEIAVWHATRGEKKIVDTLLRPAVDACLTAAP